MTLLLCHYRDWRQNALRLILLTTALVTLSGALPAATIISTFTTVGANDYLYTYFLQGITFSQNQELFIVFDATVYQALSNGQASSDFSLVVTQPNNPGGSPGGYSALALVNNPGLSGGFAVEVSFLAGSGQWASQPYLIEQFSSTGNIIGVIESGNTTLASSITPEPSTILLSLTFGTLILAFRFLRQQGG